MPRKIKYGYDNDNCPATWRLVVGLKDYCCDERDTMDNYLFQDYISNILLSLTDEVEIIEEEPEIDIQGIDKIRIELDNNGIASKIINQLVQAVKQLDSQINNK